MGSPHLNAPKQCDMKAIVALELVVRLWPLGDGVRAAAEEPSDFGLDCDWFVIAILYLKPGRSLGRGPNHAIKSLYIGKN